METRNGREGREDARQIAPGVARSDYRAGWAIVVIALVFLFCPGCGESGQDGTGPLLAMLLLAALWGVGMAVRATMRARRAERLLADAMAEIRRHMALHALKNTALVACNELLDGKPGEREWATAREALRAVLGAGTEPKP